MESEKKKTQLDYIEQKLDFIERKVDTIIERLENKN